MRARFRTRAGIALASALSVLGIAAATAGAATTTEMSDTFNSYVAGSDWEESTTHGGWRAVFDGYGRIGINRDGSKVLKLRPQASSEPGETHAALVVSRKSFGDMDMSMRMKTVKQLRDGSRPNPWEVAWAIWGYKDNTHFYYLALKPNGWEIGKADPAYPGAQRFLATGSGPSYDVGDWHNVRVRQVGATFTVWANGKQLTTFTDRERPYLSGNVGVYNEDAATYFDDIKVAGA